MSLEDEDKKKRLLEDEEGGETGESGAGGKSGQVEFRDFLSSGENLRDDLLSPEERKRLLAVHQSTHELRVKKQKETRDQRQALKDGKIPLQSYRQGMGAGMNSQYKINPVLADKAQFSGIDRQVNIIPTENIADTNQENRDELEYQYRLRNTPENAPRFNPKPQFNR